MIWTLNRGNFEVMESNTTAVPVYHKVHSAILSLMTNYLNGIKPLDITEDLLCLHITVLMKWSKWTLTLFDLMLVYIV